MLILSVWVLDLELDRLLVLVLLFLLTYPYFIGAKAESAVSGNRLGVTIWRRPTHSMTIWHRPRATPIVSPVIAR